MLSIKSVLFQLNILLRFITYARTSNYYLFMNSVFEIVFIFSFKRIFLKYIFAIYDIVDKTLW